jgi:hypothetical protein
VTEFPVELELKLERAQHHLVRLSEEIEDFFAPNPYMIKTEVRREGLMHVAYITFTEPLPHAFSIRIGECLYQLRSVLDHTVRMLSDVPDNSRSDEFVISNDRRRFYEGIDDRSPLIERLNAIRRPEARSFIEAVQPCNRASGKPTEHYLWVLHELFMADKHRRLLLTQAATHGSRALPVYPGLGPYKAEFRRGGLGPGAGNRAKLATISLETAMPSVDIEFHPALTIAFAEHDIARNAFVIETLDNVWRFTAFVVGKLAEYI